MLHFFFFTCNSHSLNFFGVPLEYFGDSCFCMKCVLLFLALCAGDNS